MKYSIGVRPSLEHERIGNSIVSPDVDEISPFIPAIAVICARDPRAPDVIRSYTDPILLRDSGMIFSTSLFARCQISTFFRSRSSSVRRPSLNCPMTSSDSAFDFVTIAALPFGITMSSIPHVVPETVVYLKPNCLIRSRIG